MYLVLGCLSVTEISLFRSATSFCWNWSFSVRFSDFETKLLIAQRMGQLLRSAGNLRAGRTGLAHYVSTLGPKFFAGRSHISTCAYGRTSHLQRAVYSCKSEAIDSLS